MGLHAIELSSSVIGTLLSLQSEEISRTHLELGKLKEQQNKCRFVTFEDIDSLRNEFQAQLISEEPTAKGCEITFLKEQLAAAELSASELRTQLENEQIANESLRIAAVDRDRAHRETLDYSGEAVQSIQELRERCTHLNVQLEEERACNESLKSNSQLVGDLRKQLSELEKNFELHRSLFAKAHHDFESTSVSLAHALEEKTALESTIDQLTTEMNDQELFIGNLQQQLRTRDQMILELQASRAEVIDKAHYDDRIAALLSELSHEKETVADLKEQLLQAAFTQESKSVALGAKIPALERSDTPATDITFLECDSEQMEDAIAELSSLGDVSESATMPEDQKKQPVLDLSASQTPMPSQFATQLSDAQDSSEDATPTSSSCHITHKRFGSVPECSAIIKAKFHPLTKSPNGSNISKLLGKQNFRIMSEGDTNLVWTDCPDAGYLVVSESRVLRKTRFELCKQKLMVRLRASSGFGLFIFVSNAHYYVGTYVMSQSEKLNKEDYIGLPHGVKRVVCQMSMSGKMKESDYKNLDKLYANGELTALKYPLGRIGHSLHYKSALKPA